MKKDNTYVNKYKLNRSVSAVMPAMNSLGISAYRIPVKSSSVTLTVIVDENNGWDHLSVTVNTSDGDAPRCPTWEEMCFVKDLFFTEEEIAIQYHPPKSKYVNIQEYCLHLWRPQNEVVPAPFKYAADIKNQNIK
ncbi:MAG: hypothetical protein FWE17_01820 [Alphaproteobacteria bacterium]|nr:hypothetical protein [Alphaproteobacteria bacterium]MCL2758050.1 hypothetical protein [Alphaproteobacteria bacterium]